MALDCENDLDVCTCMVESKSDGRAFPKGINVSNPLDVNLSGSAGNGVPPRNDIGTRGRREYRRSVRE